MPIPAGEIRQGFECVVDFDGRSGESPSELCGSPALNHAGGGSLAECLGDVVMPVGTRPTQCQNPPPPPQCPRIRADAVEREVVHGDACRCASCRIEQL